MLIQILILSAPGESTMECCLLNISDAFDQIAPNTCAGKPESPRVTDTGVWLSLLSFALLHDVLVLDSEDEANFSTIGSKQHECI